MGVRWLVCNVRNGTRWLYRGYTWQRLVQSSVQSFEGAPCRAPPKALPEALPEALHEALPEALHEALPEALHEALPEALHEALPEALQKALPEPLHKALPEALYEAPSKLYTELHQSSARSSLKALRGAPSKEHTARPVLPKAPVVLAKALKPRLVVRRKLGVTENFSDHVQLLTTLSYAYAVHIQINFP